MGYGGITAMEEFVDFCIGVPDGIWKKEQQRQNKLVRKKCGTVHNEKPEI